MIFLSRSTFFWPAFQCRFVTELKGFIFHLASKPSQTPTRVCSQKVKVDYLGNGTMPRVTGKVGLKVLAPEMASGMDYIGD